MSPSFAAVEPLYRIKHFSAVATTRLVCFKEEVKVGRERVVSASAAAGKFNTKREGATITSTAAFFLYGVSVAFPPVPFS